MWRTAYQVQRDFALSSGLRSEIIWDCLAPEQSEILQQKISTLIPDIEGKSPSIIEKQRKNLFQNVWLQRKYTNRTLLSAIIYVLVTTEQNASLAKEATTFSCHPVFRTRKCLNADNSAGCCMIFIDEHGRVYANWNTYVRNNTLPKGTMIAPAKGIYTFNSDEDDDVELEYHLTPAARTKSRVLNAGDTVASVGSLVATVPLVATLALPVAAPVVLAASALAGATAVYSTMRSATRLYDRRKHGQSMGLTDREARQSWLGIAGGVAGLGASGATKALSFAASAGCEINLAAKLAVNSINVSSIVISGGGVVNGFYDLYMKLNDEEVLTGLDVLQVASSLLIFTHSINNLKIARSVTKSGNGSSLRQALFTQARKIFDRISRESSMLHGTSAQKFDIVRTLNDIPLKETLLSLHKLNSHLGGGAGTLLTYGTNLLPNLTNMYESGNVDVSITNLAEQFGNKFVQHITQLMSFYDVISALGKYLSEHAAQFILTLTRTFIETSVDNIDRTLNTFVSTETVIYRILMHCITNYADFSYKFLESKTTEIYNDIQNYFDTLNPINTSDQRIACTICNGYYYQINRESL